MLCVVVVGVGTGRRNCDFSITLLMGSRDAWPDACCWEHAGVCLWCTRSHTSVERIPLRCARADHLRSQCPDAEPERRLLCR